jgi:hypothetical protein
MSKTPMGVSSSSWIDLSAPKTDCEIHKTMNGPSLVKKHVNNSKSNQSIIFSSLLGDASQEAHNSVEG